MKFRRLEQISYTVQFLCCSLMSQRQPCPIQKRRADQLRSSFSVLLFAVPEAVSSHSKVRSRSAVQFILCVAPRCPRGSLFPYKSKEQISCAVHSLCCSLLSQTLVPYKSEENQFHPVLALQGRVPRCYFPVVQLIGL